MKKARTTYVSKIHAGGLVAFPPGGDFFIGQRAFVQVKNGAVELNAKPSGPLGGSKRLSLRLRRVSASSTKLKQMSPGFKRAVDSGVGHARLPEREQPEMQERELLQGDPKGAWLLRSTAVNE